MFPFHIPDKQYVVSLDKLDLSFLNQYVQGHTDTKRVLWSKPLMDGESVYCEVQIHLDEVQDEDSYLEPSEAYVCHICNIDVPHRYYKQHVNSSLHATYKKLSEKVLENVSKQININIDYIIDDGEKCNQFYCETCSKVVLMEHKQKHNRSKYHLQCIDNHKLADNFVEIYIDNKEVQNENESINNNKNEYGKIGNNHEYNSESDTDWNFDSDSDSENEQLFRINNVITYKTIETPNASDIENIECDNALSRVSRPSDTKKELTHFQEYLKEIISKYKYYSKFDLPIIEDNSIAIITPEGYKEKITIDAFHSYKKINSFIFCQLCKERVGQETSQHSNTKRHVKNIMEPVNNSFARVMIGSKAWSHCLLCNDIVASGSDHVNSYHKKPIENKSKCNEARVPSKSNTMMPKMTFCDVCDVYIDAYDFSTHDNDKSHVNKLKVVKKKPNSIVVEGNTASAHNVVSNEKANSGTSNIALNNDMVPIAKKSSDNNLVNSVKSTLKQTNTTESNKLIEVENKITTGHNLPSTSKAKPDAPSPQITTEKNLTTTKKLIEYNKQMAEFNENSVECLVCDLKVPTSDKNIIEHVEGFRHKKAVEVLLREHNIKQRSYNLYECKYCNSSFDDFIDHIHENLIHTFAKALCSYLKE